MLTKTNVLKQDVMEECLPMVHDMICKIAWDFQKTYGSDFDEWLSEGYYIYCKVMQSHSYQHASLNTWLYNKLRWGMLDCLRKKQRAKRMGYYEDMLTENKDELQVEEVLTDKRTQSFVVMLEHVNDTTWELWQLILEPPAMLQDELDYKTPETAEDALVHYCKHTLKWTTQQIATSFDELVEILND